MNVKVPASLTEEIIKAQIKSFLTDGSESIPTPASWQASSIDMCSEQYQRERLRELQQTWLVELQKYLV